MTLLPLLDSRTARPTPTGYLPPAGFVLVAANTQLPANQAPAPEAPTKTSTLAVIAFIAAFVFPPLALVLGPMAMVEIKRTPGLRGNGFAAYAVFVTYLPLLVIPVGFLTVFILHVAIGSPMFVDVASLMPWA